MIWGTSLFENLAANRTCGDALILNTFCDCNKEVSLSITQLGTEIGKDPKEIGESLINSLNDLTKSHRDKCEIFKLQNIESVTRKYYLHAYYDVSNEII